MSTCHLSRAPCIRPLHNSLYVHEKNSRVYCGHRAKLCHDHRSEYGLVARLCRSVGELRIVKKYKPCVVRLGTRIVKYKPCVVRLGSSDREEVQTLNHASFGWGEEVQTLNHESFDWGTRIVKKYKPCVSLGRERAQAGNGCNRQFDVCCFPTKRLLEVGRPMFLPSGLGI